MIAEPPVIISFQEHIQKEAPSDASPIPLSLRGVVATLQVVLATRRAARNAVCASALPHQVWDGA